MNDTTIDPDQTDEETLTYEVSDEALEAAGGTKEWYAATFGCTGTVTQPYCVR